MGELEGAKPSSNEIECLAKPCWARRATGAACTFAVSNVFGKQELENSSNGGLNKEKLCKKCKGEIEANELQPISKQSPHIESSLIVIIEERGDKAHGRAHDSNRCTDNCHFKKNGMRGARIKVFASKFERKRRT